MDNLQRPAESVKNLVLLLTKNGRPIEFVTDVETLEFTGEFIEVRDYHPDFNGEAKAVFTRKLMGGAYLKAGRQPEEAHELARRHPGRIFWFDYRRQVQQGAQA